MKKMNLPLQHENNKFPTSIYLFMGKREKMPNELCRRTIDIVVPMVAPRVC